MRNLKIAVILEITRPGRNGKAVADWVIEQAKDRFGATYELVDLANYPLPHLDEVIPASWGKYSTSGVLKNAIDYRYAEWSNPAAAFVSYGALGGSRAIEHLRGISAELQTADVRQQLSFSLITDFENSNVFRPAPIHQDFAPVLFDQLEA